MSKIYIIYGASQSGKSLFAQALISRIYASRTSDLSPKQRTTPEYKEADQVLTNIAKDLYAEENEIFQRCIEAWYNEDVKYFKKYSYIDSLDNGTPRIYTPKRQSLENALSVLELSLGIKLEKHIQLLNHKRAPEYYDRPTEQELIEEWKTIVKDFLGIDNYLSHATAIYYSGFAHNAISEVFKEYVAKHVFVNENGLAFIPKKLSTRARRVGESYLVDKEGKAEDYDLEFEVGKSFLDRENPDKIRYSSKYIKRMMEEGKTLVIPTGSLGLVEYLVKTYGNACTLLGTNHILRGYGEMLEQEVDRNGISVENGEKNLEKVLYQNGVDASIVKNRFYNQFVVDFFFSQLPQESKENVLKLEGKLILTDPAGWLDNSKSWFGFGSKSATQAFESISADAIRHDHGVNAEEVLKAIKAVQSTPARAILKNYMPLFDASFCPENVPIDSPACHAFLQTRLAKAWIGTHKSDYASAERAIRDKHQKSLEDA